MKKVLLCGYMGVGKTTVGMQLAQSTGFEFRDLDECVERSCGVTVPEIFAVKGEIAFRKLERQQLFEQINEPQNMVLALGGGTPAYGGNHLVFERPDVAVFYLQASVGLLVERLSSAAHQRPLLAKLSEFELPEFIAKHLFERQVFYRHHTTTISVDGKNAETIAREILLHLG